MLHKNTLGLKENIDLINVPQYLTLHRLDVKSICASIPTWSSMIDTISDRWNYIQPWKEIDLKWMTLNFMLHIKNDFLSTTFGAPMGSSISPFIVKLILQHLENKILSFNWHNNALEHYKNYSSSLKFTKEIEEHSNINFLDFSPEQP